MCQWLESILFSLLLPYPENNINKKMKKKNERENKTAAAKSGDERNETIKKT